MLEEIDRICLFIYYFLNRITVLIVANSLNNKRKTILKGGAYLCQGIGNCFIP